MIKTENNGRTNLELAIAKYDNKLGGFRKIDDGGKWVKSQCKNPEHRPPMHICLQPGTYEYTCPACGHVTNVHVPSITM